MVAAGPSLLRAQVPVSALGEFFAARSERGLASRGALFVTAGGPQLEIPRARRLPVGARHGVLRVAQGMEGALMGHSDATWSPPRHLLMDRARLGVGALPLGIPSGSGQGVVIGIIDGGVAVSHPDLRRADGTTRVAWSIDFASNPAGLHPALESALGCEPDAGLRCQILSGADIDERLLGGAGGAEPRDPTGHGTHVASIAAGNGLAGGGASFTGIAPQATLIVARVTGSGGTIADSDVVLATQFVFERAAELGMPAVVNLSLGGDFGAHDGSSPLSQVLASWVGRDAPGRAIVVAGGNSGELQRGIVDGAPERLGIHAERVIERGAALRVPLLTPYPRHGGATTDASFFVWLNLSSRAGLTLRLELPDGARSNRIGLGQVETVRSGELVAAIVHGLAEDGAAALRAELPELVSEDVLPTPGAAVIIVDGRWPAGEAFTIELEGEGRAQLWVQSEGDLAPETGSVGALFPGASPERTVTIPAAHPELIAVGASVNRLGWTDFSGVDVDLSQLAVEPALTPGGAAFFSSAGPNALGDVKPDLLAPGGFVVAAMAATADPRRGAPGIFSGGLCSGLGCQVVNDDYAATAGTSMAAPMVSGAVALLLERDATLTQDGLRRLLQSGSVPLRGGADVAGREGGGVIDISRSLEALSATARGPAERPDPERSRLRPAASFAEPDPTRSLAALLWLRDAEGASFDAEPSRIRVTLSGGQLSQPPLRVGPGLYELRVAAARDARRLQIEAWVDDEWLLSSQIPVAAAAPRAGASARGCSSVVTPARPGAAPAAATGVGWLALLLCRRRALARVRSR